MGLSSSFLGAISQLVGFYLLLIFIYIIVSWLPGSWARSKPAFWLSQIVNPYLNLFRKLRFLQLGTVDLSPILAVAVLYFLQGLLSSLRGGKLSLLSVLTSLIWLVLSLGSSIISVITVILIIRLVLYYIKPNSNNVLIGMIDSAIRGLMAKTISLFTKKSMNFSNALMLTTLVFALLWLLLRYVSGILMQLG